MSKESPINEKVHKELKDKRDEKNPEDFNERITSKARQLLVRSQMYKQTRMNTIASYERLYNNDTLPRLRQMFNTTLPVFSGMIDELLAMFNDQIQIKFKATNPSQYLVIPKIQAHWENERDSLAPNAMWNYKARTDRFNAVLSGRGILQEFAYNDPEYKNVLHVVNYSDFHCDPLGGGVLENHSFCGTESNFMTLYDLKSNDDYDQEQVALLEKFSWSNDYFTSLETTYGTKFARWKALGLDVETNNFSGDARYNFCNFVITEDGCRYNVVFEPCSGIWVKVKRWDEVYPSSLYPWKSYATHEDEKNFWSKSYADDFFSIADSVITLFNQELTNREKKNFHSRAYDVDMFPDVAKLDAAQYRPDSLVPANTQGGARSIASGIYTFDTPELKGTVDLISWMSNYTGQKTGADELPPAGGKNKVGIVLAQQQKQSKRIGLRSDSWEECYAQLGTTFVEGMKEFMPPTISIQVIGENGFIEDSELKRIDIRRCGMIGISVTSTNEQESSDAMKKDGQVKAIEMVAQNPNLTKYEKETIYRNIGQFDESEITFLLDTQGSMSRRQVAHASQAVQSILTDKTPDIYYGADMSYIAYIRQYIIDHKIEIKGKEQKFMSFLDEITPIIQKNMEDAGKNAPKQPQQEDNKQPQQPTQRPQQKATLPAVAQRVGQSMM